MSTKSLSKFTTILLLAVIACTPSGEPGATDPGTTEVATTGTSTGETPTSTGTPTTGTSTTSGDSESASESTSEMSASTGTTTEATTEAVESSTGSTGDESSSSTGAESSSTGAESSSSTGDESSTGEPVVPLKFDECREGDASMCPAQDPACLVVDGPGGFGPDGSFFVTWSYCSRECDVDEDCVSGVPGGTAEPLCVAKGPNMVKVCVLDCSFGKTCPDSLECSNDGTCGTRFCNCTDAGCQDSLCTG
jgi:hypothetical protein